MKPGVGVVQIGVKVFQVLAWVSLVVQGLLGLVLLVTGGEPVPVGGVDIPARMVGVLNLVAAAIYFFMMNLVASVLQVLLELRGSRPS